MAHAWVDVTYLEQADYEGLAAARKARRENPRAAKVQQPR
jgi:hypothetical protein